MLGLARRLILKLIVIRIWIVKRIISRIDSYWDLKKKKIYKQKFVVD